MDCSASTYYVLKLKAASAVATISFLPYSQLLIRQKSLQKTVFQSSTMKRSFIEKTRCEEIFGMVGRVGHSYQIGALFALKRAYLALLRSHCHLLCLVARFSTGATSFGGRVAAADL